MLRRDRKVAHVILTVLEGGGLLLISIVALFLLERVAMLAEVVRDVSFGPQPLLGSAAHISCTNDVLGHG